MARMLMSLTFTVRTAPASDRWPEIEDGSAYELLTVMPPKIVNWPGNAGETSVTTLPCAMIKEWITSMCPCR